MKSICEFLHVAPLMVLAAGARVTTHIPPIKHLENKIENSYYKN